MTKGSCLCGAVGFEITAPLQSLYVCHCSICRKASGTATVSVAIVPRSEFRWTHGEDLIRKWVKPDADWQTWFCDTCGTPLPLPNDDRHMAVHAGLLQDIESSLSVAAHIWTGSKAPWHEIAGDADRHAEHFGSGDA